MLKSPPLVATLSDSMRMSPCSWGDIFTWPLRGDRIIGLRQQIALTMFSRDFLWDDLTFRQPSAEINNQPNLRLRRWLGIALLVHVGRVGIQIGTQRPLMHALECLGVFENKVHRCPPGRRICQENTDRTMPGQSTSSYGWVGLNSVDPG